jgi:hypothetical protein
VVSGSSGVISMQCMMSHAPIQCFSVLTRAMIQRQRASRDREQRLNLQQWVMEGEREGIDV